jgi:BR serine/threonine kinase
MLAGSLPFAAPRIRDLLAKVKRGEFTMPDCHPDIQDMISRMICVDPAARIKMAQLKQHPAFRMFLPASYIVSSPIPSRPIEGPIEVATVRRDVKEALERLGVGDEELRTSLASSESNLVKIFVAMITRKSRLDELPWSESLTSVVSMETVGFETHPIKMANSVEMSSCQECPIGADWEFDLTQTFSPCFSTLPSLMGNLQAAMTQSGFTIFHPNDQELIGRNGAGGYFRITAVYLTRESVSVEVQLKNLLGESTWLCDKVRRLAQQGPRNAS